MEEVSEQHGTNIDRTAWRLVGPVHIAATMEQARADVRYGLAEWIDYFSNVAALPLLPPGLEVTDFDATIDMLNMSGVCLIGTPDMAAEMIQRLEKQSGGFGTFLFMSHEWADREQTKRSYELFAREVMPQFQGSTASLQASREIVRAQHPQLRGAVTDAIEAATKRYIAERETR
jgi:limonene 1,2-monooxygenase